MAIRELLFCSLVPFACAPAPMSPPASESAPTPVVIAEAPPQSGSKLAVPEAEIPEEEVPEEAPIEQGPVAPAGRVVGGVPGGVPGGVVGGVPGGVVGGVPGGIPGGNPHRAAPMTNAVPLADVMKQAVYTPEPRKYHLQATQSATDNTSRNNTTAFCVSVSGKAVDISTARPSGDADVDRICRETVTKWRFKPFIVGGQATKVCSYAKFELKFQ